MVVVSGTVEGTVASVAVVMSTAGMVVVGSGATDNIVTSDVLAVSTADTMVVVSEFV